MPTLLAPSRDPLPAWHGTRPDVERLACGVSASTPSTRATRAGNLSGVLARESR